ALSLVGLLDREAKPVDVAGRNPQRPPFHGALLPDTAVFGRGGAGVLSGSLWLWLVVLVPAWGTVRECSDCDIQSIAYSAGVAFRHSHFLGNPWPGDESGARMEPDLIFGGCFLSLD